MPVGDDKAGQNIRARPTAARSLFLSTLPLPTGVTYAPGSVVEAVRVWLRQVKDKRREEGSAFGMHASFTNSSAFGLIHADQLLCFDHSCGKTSQAFRGLSVVGMHIGSRSLTHRLGPMGMSSGLGPGILLVPVHPEPTVVGSAIGGRL